MIIAPTIVVMYLNFNRGSVLLATKVPRNVLNKRKELKVDFANEASLSRGERRKQVNK